MQSTLDSPWRHCVSRFGGDYLLISCSMWCKDPKLISAIGKKEQNGAKILETDYSFPYMRQVDNNTFWEKFVLGVWNPEKRKFLGRTKKMWGIVFLFYTVFYAVLAGLIAMCMYGLMATIDEKTPKYILANSIIGTNPGVAFRPLSNDEKEPSLVFYNPNNNSEIRMFSDNIEELLKEYNNTQSLHARGSKQVVCNYTKYPEPDEVCAVDMSRYGNCTADNQYAYRTSSPCFFIKLNKIYGWKPEFYHDTQDLPEDLRTHIASLPETERNQIWVSCDGVHEADREAMGEVVYAPGRGLPGYYYPYTNEPGYLSPLISVQFIQPKINYSVNIECRAWAKNIVYNQSLKDPMGYVRFQFKIVQNT